MFDAINANAKAKESLLEREVRQLRAENNSLKKSVENQIKLNNLANEYSRLHFENERIIQQVRGGLNGS